MFGWPVPFFRIWPGDRTGMSQEILTERLHLRPLRPDDAAPYARLISDRDVIRMLARPPCPFTLADARGFVTRNRTRPWCYAIEIGRLIGCVTITDHLGYWLGKPYWGHGYATEAAGAVVDAYFAGTDDQQVLSGAFTDNPASLRVLEKLGFVATGVSRVRCIPRAARSITRTWSSHAARGT